MAINQERINENIEKYSQYFIETKQNNPRRHLFWVTNLDNPNAAGHGVLGHQIEGMINDDKYKFEYLGLNGSADATAKFQAKGELQLKEIEAGKLRKQQRSGYVPEEVEKAAEVPAVKAPTAAEVIAAIKEGAQDANLEALLEDPRATVKKAAEERKASIQLASGLVA